MRLAARTEGMVTDPVYEGKSMAGLVDLVSRTPPARTASSPGLACDREDQRGGAGMSTGVPQSHRGGGPRARVQENPGGG
jgi:hypothetical protein